MISLVFNLSCGDDTNGSGDAGTGESDGGNAARTAAEIAGQAAEASSRSPEDTSSNREGGAEAQQESGNTRSDQSAVSEGPDIPPALKNYVDSYDFSLPRVILPSHDLLGKVQSPLLMSAQEKRIHDLLSPREYWQSVDFQEFGLSRTPRPPFRSVNIYSVRSLGNSRFDIACELRSFESTHFLQIVVYYDGNTARIVHIAGLSGSGDDEN